MSIIIPDEAAIRSITNPEPYSGPMFRGRGVGRRLDGSLYPISGWTKEEWEREFPGHPFEQEE